MTTRSHLLGITLVLPGAVMLLQVSIASGQTTLLVRDDSSVVLDAPTGADEALRASTGGSVRRLDASLEDMALAAGCTEEPESAPCVASLAAAAQAEWVVVEHTSRAPAGWRVRLDVRRGATGARERTVDVSCASRAECASALRSALAPPSETSTVVVARGQTAPPTTDVPPRASDDPRPARTTPPTGLPIVAQVLFASAAVVSVGALIAGGIGLSQGHDAWALGTLTQADVAEHAAALEASRDVALGFGTALAIAGACLAVAALVMMIVEHPSGSSLALRLGGAVTPSAAMLSLDGSF